MNKIYSLKYSHITGGLIAVSELSGRVSSRATGKKKHKRILAEPPRVSWRVFYL
ncbi:hypothetical protein BOS79_005580 [Escherichia coli]|nr:hypothetical protein [Escherichia coli]